MDLGEGDRAAADTVILRFASLTQAQEVMGSGQYLAIVGLRHRCTTPRAAFIVPVHD